VYDLLKLVMQNGKVKKWKREWDAIAERWTPLSSLPVYQFDRDSSGQVKSRAQYTPAADLQTLAEIIMLAHGDAAHKFRLQYSSWLRPGINAPVDVTAAYDAASPDAADDDADADAAAPEGTDPGDDADVDGASNPDTHDDEVTLTYQQVMERIRRVREPGPMHGYGSVYDTLKLVMQSASHKNMKREWGKVQERSSKLWILGKYQFDRCANGKVSQGAQYTPAADLETLGEIVMLAHGNAAHKFRLQCIKLLRRVWEGDESLVTEIRANAATNAASADGASTSAPGPDDVPTDAPTDAANGESALMRRSAWTPAQRGIAWDNNDGALTATTIAPDDIVYVCGLQFLKVVRSDADAYVPVGFEHLQVFYIIFHGFCISRNMPLWELGWSADYEQRTTYHKRTPFPTSRLAVLMATTGLPSKLIETDAKKYQFNDALIKLDTNTETFFDTKEGMLQRAKELYSSSEHMISKTFVDPELGLDAHPFVRPKSSARATDAGAVSETIELARMHEETVRKQQALQAKLDQDTKIIQMMIDKEYSIDDIIKMRSCVRGG
jgi:hypothetical protein